MSCHRDLNKRLKFITKVLTSVLEVKTKTFRNWTSVLSRPKILVSKA